MPQLFVLSLRSLYLSDAFRCQSYCGGRFAVLVILSLPSPEVAVETWSFLGITFYSFIAITMNSTAPDYVVESQQGPLVGMQIFLLTMAVIFCSLRMVSRLIIVGSLGLDDYLMVLATVRGFRSFPTSDFMLMGSW